ncbi:MAG: hypothetical protein SWX82_10390 [Cyanobacteriota bacterium]|nr:hypothetical protein [Cyanobacteriota bacterium]
MKQLESNNPAATDAEKQAFVTASIPPNNRQRFVGALQAGGKEALKELLDNPYVNVGVAIVEGWQNQIKSEWHSPSNSIRPQIVFALK